MEQYELQKLRALPIEATAMRLGLHFVRHRCLCCFHDDHRPSLGFNVSKNSFRCYSCEAHGGVIDLAMRVLNKGFVEACQWLADEHNIILAAPPPNRSSPLGGNEGGHTFDASRYVRYFEHPWLSPDACHFLFDVRKLHPAVVRFCRLNSYRDWLQIPYYDCSGQLIGLQRRYMGNDPNQPRFRFERGEQCHLYNLQVLPMLKPREPLYIGEGPSDVWSLLSSSRKAIGIPSATLLKASDLSLLEILKPLETPLHIYPDADAAGEMLYQKLVAAANQLGLCLVRHELKEGCKDYSDEYCRTRS